MTEKFVGKSVPRIDAIEKVTGTALYAYDVELPGMLYVKILRSPYAHARIKTIDTGKAEQAPGVICIVTGNDFTGKLGIYIGDRDLLPRDKVLWVGHPVAAVVAEKESQAEVALDLIEIEYEELPAVLDSKTALQETAPLVHPQLGEYPRSPAFSPKAGTNIANVFHLKKGDVEQAFKEADLIVENEFVIPQVSHAYMEPISVVAHYRTDGHVEVWSSAQSPFTVRYLTSVTMGIPVSKIQVNSPYLGGGFGGKAGLNFEPLAILCSKKAGFRPVKISLSREENMTSAAVRTGLTGQIKTAVKNGRITGEKIRYILDAGAYADYACNVGRATGYAGIGPYDIDNVEVESLTVYTNKVYATAFRGFGHMEFHFVLERQHEIVARRLGMSSLEFRLKNVQKPGVSNTGTGERVREDAGDAIECLKKVAEALELDKAADRPLEPWIFRGRGLAVFMKAPAQPPNSGSAAYVKFNEDGSVAFSVGTSEMGQGTVTGLSQMVAEILQVPIEKIRIDPVRNTDTAAYTWQTVGSRSLFMDGRALIAAAEDAKEQLLSLAATVLRVPVADLHLEGEHVVVTGKPWESLSYPELVMGYMYPDGKSIGGPVIGRGKYIATGMTMLDPETGQGNPAIFETYGVQGVDLDVNALTGELRIHKLVSAFDLGRTINPQIVEGQVFGGSVMAMGLGISEFLQYDSQGKLMNSNLTDYKVSRAKDIPAEQVAILIENPQGDGPFGARGIGELVMIGVPAAIGNAIADALDVDIKELPMTPQNVWKAIKSSKPDLIEKLKHEITSRR
ncbi:MAG: xanthine dehydrogenase family protein molybdopterin-binding subunit [Candidatus Odinarchaeota archaeon]